jgi:plasmid stabilization system protein ParE
MPGRMTVSFAASSVADLEAMLEWYGEQQTPEVGERLVGEIVGKIEALRDYPEMGRVVPEFGRDNLRELIHPPFRIVYRRDVRKVRVIRVWRSERLLKLDKQ